MSLIENSFDRYYNRILKSMLKRGSEILIQHSVLNRLRDMDSADAVFTDKIGDCPGNFQNPGISSGAKTEAIDSHL